jgi:hypothetical protein
LTRCTLCQNPTKTPPLFHKCLPAFVNKEQLPSLVSLNTSQPASTLQCALISLGPESFSNHTTIKTPWNCTASITWCENVTLFPIMCFMRTLPTALQILFILNTKHSNISFPVLVTYLVLEPVSDMLD